jgi:polyribonucleotide nucleotidyltransferase
MKRTTIEVDLNNGKIVFETGKVAKQANGSVIVSMGETMVFTTACASKAPLDNVDFLPLRIDYQEKFASAGKTVSGFIKREGRPSQREILVCRLIDRPLRPLFPAGFYHDLQILSYVWSYDGINSPDHLAICAASCALIISDIPFVKPVGGVRVGMIDGEFVVNPTVEQKKTSKLDLLLAGTQEAILMIEGHCDFLTEEEVLTAIEVGHESIKKICQAQEDFRKEIGKEKMEVTLRVPSEEAFTSVEKIASPLLEPIVRIVDKKKREEGFSEVKKVVFEALEAKEEDEEGKFSSADLNVVFKKVSSQALRRLVLEEDVRCDGRKLDEVRFIDIEQSMLPRVHGSSLFTRGETQSMAICTLGGESMGQRYETLDTDGIERFYLQYFFPPFSVGEVGRVGAPGRREVGHGKLAERALLPSLPSLKDFPYTIRLESNITESNGSSSMASVCGGCLSMMDAGVPIKRPVSGIAMGLVLEGDNFKILSDILGIEDALGDMDFKITGDADGITAFQMDIKVEGITSEIMRAALKQARAGRVHILEKMLEACPKYREVMSEHAPRIETIQLKPSKIGSVIGPGGKMIRSIIEETGVDIDINDDGVVNIASSNAEGLERAKSIIEGLVAEVEINKVYKGKVVSIVPFGMFVEVLPGKEGLCHISEIDHSRVESASDFFKEGEHVDVKVIDINERGQLKLSRKVLLPKPEKQAEKARN